MPIVTTWLNTHVLLFNNFVKESRGRVSSSPISQSALTMKYLDNEAQNDDDWITTWCIKLIHQFADYSLPRSIKHAISSGMVSKAIQPCMDRGCYTLVILAWNTTYIYIHAMQINKFVCYCWTTTTLLIGLLANPVTKYWGFFLFFFSSDVMWLKGPLEITKILCRCDKVEKSRHLHL